MQYFCTVQVLFIFKRIGQEQDGTRSQVQCSAVYVDQWMDVPVPRYAHLCSWAQCDGGGISTIM